MARQTQIRVLAVALLLLDVAGLSEGRAEEVDGKFFFVPGVYYTRSRTELETTSGTSTTKGSLLSLNINAGYGFGGGVFAGVKYLNESSNEESVIFATTDEDDLGTTALGLLVGFAQSGFFVGGSYMILQPPKKEAGTTTYEGKGGWAIDVAYFVDMGGWALGPQITYRSFEYDTMILNGSEVETFVSLTEDRQYPYFTLMLTL